MGCLGRALRGGRVWGGEEGGPLGGEERQPQPLLVVLLLAVGLALPPLAVPWVVVVVEA